MLRVFFIYLCLVMGLFAAELPTDKQPTEANNSKTSAENSVGNTHLTKWLINNKSNLDQIVQDNVKESKTKWFNEEEINSKTGKVKAKKEFSSGNAFKDNFIEYVVKKGDTIYSISHKYSVSVDDVMTWNNLTPKSSLSIGQKVKIYLYQPAEASDPVSESNNSTEDTKQSDAVEGVKSNYPQYSYYKVKKGDTINIIAKSHNMTGNELIVLNSLKSNQVLSIGMILKVNTNYGKKVVSDKHTILEEGFAWPAVGRLVMPFGLQEKGLFNEGINIALHEGTSIKATQDGIVTYTGNTLKNFGNIVIVQHDNNWLSIYANLSKVTVKKGQHVKQGEEIAKSGKSGHVKTAQLHFELRYNIKPMDPLNYLNSYN